MKKLFFIIAIGGSITAIGCSNSATPEPGTGLIQEIKTIKEDVNVQKFAELIAKGNGQLLDVRTPEEWADGTIKGANKMNFFDGDFDAQLTKLNKDNPVYVYCKSGGRSGWQQKKCRKWDLK